MKKLLSTAALAIAFVIPGAAQAEHPDINIGEQLYMMLMAGQLTPKTRAAFSAMMYAYNVDCEPLDSTIIIESNKLAANAEPEVMRHANDLIDFSMRSMGKEPWCELLKPTVEKIKSHAEDYRQ